MQRTNGMNIQISVWCHLVRFSLVLSHMSYSVNVVITHVPCTAISHLLASKSYAITLVIDFYFLCTRLCEQISKANWVYYVRMLFEAIRHCCDLNIANCPMHRTPQMQTGSKLSEHLLLWM